MVLVLKEQPVVTSSPSIGTSVASDRSRDAAAPANSAVTGEIELGGKCYLTSARLASVLGLTERTLSRWHTRRVGPPRIKIGRLVLFPVEKLPIWFSTRETQPARLERKQGDKR
jgi:hypothetical protein